jgi:hypothetical protein
MNDERDIEQEIRAAQERTKGLRAALQARTEHTVGSQYLLDATSFEADAVVAWAEARYRPPAFVSRLMPKQLHSALLERLAELRAFNEAMVGTRVARAEVLLHGDLERRALTERWLRWADAYVVHRLARKNPRDDDNPLLTYLRICEELVPWLDQLAYGSQDERRIDTVHRQILGSVVEFIPWRLYHATWSSWIRPTDRGGADFFPSAPLSPFLITVAKEQLELYTFHTGAGLDIVLASVDPVAVDDDAARVELQSLADDIEEMRPFLVRAVRPERFVIPLADRLYAAPVWVLLGGHVTLIFARSERDLIEGIHRMHHTFQLLIGFDGLLRHPVFHWRTSEQLPAPALGVNLAIVRTVHARLMQAFSRIDVEAILRGRQDGVDDQTDEQTLEPLARANAVLAIHDDEGDEGDEGEQGVEQEAAAPRAASVSLSPRLRQLLVRLERDFDCRVRSGKGSELSIFRPGGRIFTLGRHKRNDRIRWPHLRHLLRALGIAEEDWVRSVCGS